MRYGLDRYFGCIVVADYTKNHKPHPEPIYLSTGFSKTEVLYIGDSVNDYRACGAANIDSVLAKWGCIDDSWIKPIDFTADHPSNVPAILKKLG